MTATLLQGILDGFGYGLLAVGLVLVYRINRFVNAAHAQLGVVASLLLAKLVLDHDWSYWPALAVAVLAAVGAAVLIERLVISRLQERSGITLFIVSTGLAQILLALAYVKTLRPSPSAVVNEGYPVPFRISFDVAGLQVQSQHVLILILAPTITLAIAAGLRWTSLGKALRAAAANPEAARLAAIPVRRLATGVWALAGVLSAVTALLQAPNQATFSLQALGPGLLLRALAAAALAGFSSLGGAFLAAVGLGVVQGILLGVTREGGTTEVIMFGITLVALYIRRDVLVDRRGSAPALDARTVIAVPDIVRNLPLVRWNRQVLWSVTTFVVVMLPLLPPLHSPGSRFLLSLVAIFALIGVSLTVLTGWSGQVSLGHMAIVGVACFAAARLAEHGWSLGELLITCGALGAVVAVAIGAPTLKSQGIAMAITSLGFALVASEWLLRQPWLAGTPGATSEPLRMPVIGAITSQLGTYYTSAIVLGLMLTSCAALRATRVGRLLLAVRDNEPAAEAFGISAARTRLVGLALSGWIAGMAGVLWLQAWRTSDVTQFSPDASFVILAVPAIGGLDSLAGAVAGAVFVFGVPFLTQDLIKSIFSNSLGFTLLLSGVGLVATQLQFPGGAADAARRAWQRLLNRMARELGALDTGDAAPETGHPDPFGTDAVATTSGPRVSLASTAGPTPTTPIQFESGPVVQTKDVVVRFGGITAVDGVSVEVGRNEIVGLIGANGAGKTTLFNAIAGAVKPTSGEIALNGVPVNHLPAHGRNRLGLGRSFQDARLFPGLTVTETIQVGLARRHRTGSVAALLGLPNASAVERRCRDEAAEIIARFGLAPWSEVPVSRLSTGTRRVCDFAAQFAARPAVLLLDEPTAGIAQRDAEAFGQTILDIQQELGCSVLIIEHDLPLLLGLTNRLYAMESGRIIAEGTPDVVRNDARVIASYLGTTPGAIERSGGVGVRGGASASSDAHRSARVRTM